MLALIPRRTYKLEVTKERFDISLGVQLLSISFKILVGISSFCLNLSVGENQGWKLKPKPKPENPVLKEILETETDTYLAKILKT